MTRRIALILAGFGLAATSAAAQQGAAVEPAPELKALADSCAARKFETVVVVDGSGKGKKVKICGRPGQSDADWLVTLKDSAGKVEGDPAMAKAVKDQILTALRTEIAVLEKAIAAAPPPAATALATIAVSPSPVIVPEAAPRYSSVPALPVPRPKTAAAGLAAEAAPLVRPRLTIRCALPREPFGSCASLRRETQILIRADEDMPNGASLRFLRGGDPRAEIDLGSLKKGASLREKLPGRVCAGVLRGKVQVQVTSKGRVADTYGPYALYCGS